MSNTTRAKPKGSPRRSSSRQPNQSIDGLVEVLVQEFTKDKLTDRPLHEKIAIVFGNISAFGLNDQVLTKRKKQIKKPVKL